MERTTATTTVVAHCSICGRDNTFDVPTDVLVARSAPNRRPIQEIWPGASSMEREQLITGSHVACSEELFAFFAPDDD